MALSETTQFIEISTPDLSTAIPSFIEGMRLRGYCVTQRCMADKVWELELSKGNQIMQVMGMQIGMKVQVWQESGGVALRMSPNLLTRQGLQAAILYFICTPALLMPAWGLLQQHRMDTEVMELMTRCLQHHPVHEV